MSSKKKILRERLGGIQADQKRIGDVIAERTNLQPEAIGALFLEAQTKDAAYAVGAGIIHEIRDAKIPAGTPVVSMVFKR